MFKRKCKFLLLLVSIIILISSLSFATVEPRTSDETDIMPISENSENDISQEPTSENPVEDTNLEWINNDLYFAGDKVTVDQIVDGNAFIIADEVVISGEIGGDVFVCANKLTIKDGYVYSSLFAVANEIIINGIVYDVYAISNNFTLDTDGYVYRDLKVSANTLNINGKVRRDAYLTAATYNFSTENGALIGGKLEYSGASEISIPEGIVTGEIKYNKETIQEENVADKVFSYIFNVINSLVYTLVVVLLAIWLAPKFTDRVANMSTKKALVSFGIGIVAPIVIIIALLLLLFSVVCTNITLAATFLFIAICMSGTAFASIYFGGLFAKLAKWDGKVKFVLATLISTLIIWVISQIPYIGEFFGFLIALFGIGILLVNAVYRKEETKEEIKEETAK